MKRDHSAASVVGALGGILRRVWMNYQSQNIGLVAAGVAFYGLLSLFPAITALVAVAGLLTDPAFLIQQGQDLATNLPTDVREIILSQLEKVVTSDADTLSATVVVGLFVALFSASRAVSSLIQGLNIAYGAPETRSYLALRLRILLLTLCMVIGVVATLALVAALPAVLAFLPLDIGVENVLLALRWFVLFALAAISMSFLYRFGPDRRLAVRRWLTPGSLIACTLWLFANFGFSAYVQSFGTYSEVFGALGGVIVLLTWLWLSAVVLLLGALVDAEVSAEIRAS